MTHQFDTALAEKYGVVAALLINHLQFWIQKNASEGINYRSEHTWTFCSVKGLQNLFPYLTEKSIRNALALLIQEGYIITACYCDDARNRTKWYAFTNEQEAGIRYPVLTTDDEQADEQADDKPQTPDNKPQTDKNAVLTSSQETDTLCFALSDKCICQKGQMYKEDISKKIEKDCFVHSPKQSKSAPQSKTDPAIINQLKTQFDQFRRAYRGTKRGFDAEFTAFIRKYPTRWPQIVPLLAPAYQKQEAARERLRLAGWFVPQPKNLKTYLNQACWTEIIFEPDAKPLQAIDQYNSLPAGREVL